MTRTPLQRAFGAARIALLASSLAGAAWCLVLLVAPTEIDALREGWIDERAARLEQALRAAQRAAALDPRAGRGDLERFVQGLGPLRPGDRDVPLAMQALESVGRAAEIGGDLSAATAAAANALGLSPNDARARNRHARLLCAAPATRGEGVHRLRELNRLFPGVAFAAEALAAELRADGDVGGAFDVLHRVQADAAVTFWRVFAPGLPGRLTLAANGLGEHTVLEFTIPAGLADLELEPPAGIGLRIRTPRIAVANRAGRAEVDLVALEPELHGIARDRQDLLTTWDVPGRIRLHIPHIPASWEHLITITARIDVLPTTGLLLLAGDARAPAVAAARAAQGDGRMHAALAALADTPVPFVDLEVYWDDGTEFSVDRRVKAPCSVLARDGELRFALAVPAFGSARQVRVDFPAVDELRRRFVLQRIEVDDAEGTAGTGVDPAGLFYAKDLRVEGDALVATGDDPYVVVDLPRRAAGLVQIRVQGVVR